eukprot:2646556-Prymnesium_polylepis.1
MSDPNVCPTFAAGLDGAGDDSLSSRKSARTRCVPQSSLYRRCISRNLCFHRDNRVDYSAPRVHGGADVDAAVAKALEAVARGASLRSASDTETAPYASLNRAWKALEGDTKGPAWQAYVASLPPPAAAPVPAAPAPAAAADESPLGPRLKRKANRHGDAVPYGKHGTWGEYREGVKEMTSRIDKGELSAATACTRLAAEGVHISECQLSKKAKVAPGESPVKAGAAGKLDSVSPELQKQVHEEIQVLRAHNLPVTKEMVCVMVLSRMTDEQQQELFPNGLTN